nr:zinc finger protein OZF-like [Leptinotarsa decemlineata]
MATGEYEYGVLIKEEVVSDGDENNTNFEEKCDALETSIVKKEFEPEYIKHEDIDMVYNLKSEECLEEVKEGLLCEECGGATDIFGPDSVESSCKCQCQNESNAMQDEDMSRDFKPLIFGSDSGNSHFEIPEEKLVVKEEVVYNENVPSTSSKNEISIESFHVVKHETPQKTEKVNKTFRSGYYLNSVGQSIQEENKTCSKNVNEKTDSENRSTKKIPFSCKVCTKSFSQNCDLKRHSMIHTCKKPFQCKSCSRSFTYRSNLKWHEKHHTSEKPFQCKICSKSFVQGSDFKRHEKIHTGEKPFQCKSCSKSFTFRSNLKLHEKHHTGEKPFQCKICSKSFIQASDLKRHEKIHTCEKPFQCEICLKSFIRSGDLKRHEKIHSGEKPFHCKICSKSFTQKGNLKLHEKIHTGEKPFQCEICSKSFIRRGDLKRHEKMHTG